MTVLVVALFIIEEQFPFSNFPMYSNFDNEADVIFVTDQNGDPVPMDHVFRTGSAATKKVYKSELADLVNPRGRDTKDSTLQERSEAGAEVLGMLVERVRPHRLPDGVTGFRLYRRTFRVEGSDFIDLDPEQLAEVSL